VTDAPIGPSQERENTTGRSIPVSWRILQGVIGLITSVVVCGAIVYYMPFQTGRYIRSVVSEYLTKMPFVRIDHQVLSNEISVKAVSLETQGFLVLFFADAYDSPGDNVVANSELLPAGRFKNILLSIDVPAIMQNAKQLWAPGARYFVVLYQDDGDGLFDKDADTPVYDFAGDAVMDDLYIL
jgi:hypothetical protein